MEAHEKRRSDQALLEGQVVLAATAASQTKDGQRLWNKVARGLEKRAAAG